MKHAFSMMAVVAGIGAAPLLVAADNNGDLGYHEGQQGDTQYIHSSENTYREIPSAARQSNYRQPRYARGNGARQSMVRRDNYFYAGGEFGHTRVEYADSRYSHDTDILAGIYGGYAFNENFRAELGLRALVSDEESYYYEGYYLSDEYTQTALQVSGLAVLPLNHNVSFYARLGVALTEASNTITSSRDYYSYYARSVTYDKNETVLLGGLGMEFRLWQELHLKVDYTAYEEAFDSDLSTLAVGVNWQFR